MQKTKTTSEEKEEIESEAEPHTQRMKKDVSPYYPESHILSYFNILYLLVRRFVSFR